MKKRIGLDLDIDLRTDENDQLTINISKAEGNTLEIKPGDGLYAPAPNGVDGSTGTGYPDTPIIRDGVRIGYIGPYTNNKASGRISLTNGIHRIYEASDHKGKVLLDFRPEIDTVLAGDMYRVKNDDDTYSYYLITWTTTTDTGLGNQVYSSILLGSW